MFDIQRMILLAPGILAALTVHEFSHGWAAYKLGDDTAKKMGRLTLNPIAHLDPIGTIMLFVFYFGWAKPVPVNPYNFRGNIRHGMIWVALAGPLSNIVFAAVLGTAFRILVATGALGNSTFLISAFTFAIFINLMLAFFNLIPIPPLDGSKIVEGLLPVRYLPAWANFERYGFFILIGIIMAGRFLHFPIFGLTILPMARLFFYVFTGFNSPV